MKKIFRLIQIGGKSLGVEYVIEYFSPSSFVVLYKEYMKGARGKPYILNKKFLFLI